MSLKFDGLREPLSLTEINDDLMQVLKLSAIWSNRHQDIRITSLNDHIHQRSDAATGKRESYHYSNKAVDFVVLTATGAPSVRGMRAFYTWLHRHAPVSTDVLLEGSPPNHIHAEIDRRERPRKGRRNAD